MTHTYSGGCQCGKVRYEVQMDIGEVLACNCSRCGRLGSLLAFAPVASRIGVPSVLPSEKLVMLTSPATYFLPLSVNSQPDGVLNALSSAEWRCAE